MVLGSGSTCPHDFRFLTALPSCVLGAGLEGQTECEGAGVDAKGGWWRSSILMVVVEEGSTVGGGVREAMMSSCWDAEV